MTERGTTGAGRPQITGVPRVHQFLKLDGRSTTGKTFTLVKPGLATRVRPLTPPAVIHGSMVANGAKVIPSLDEVVACWTPAKAKPKNRLILGAGDGRRDQMSFRQQLRKRESTSTVGEMPCLRRFLELVLCRGSFPCVRDGQERSLPKGWKPST